MSGIQPAPSAMLRTTEQNLQKKAESIKKCDASGGTPSLGEKHKKQLSFFTALVVLKWTVEALDQSRNLSFENERRQNEWVARHTANDCVC